MILPTKHISAQNSILGVGAVILKHLNYPQTLSALWEHVRDLPEIKVYWRFILGLDLLYAIGVIDLSDGLIVRKEV
jgi:hypothetical protein